MSLHAVNGSAAADGRRCDLCNSPAIVTMLDGTATCYDCTPKSRSDEFESLHDRARWFWRQWRDSQALPAWWVAWRFLQVEYRLRRR